MRQFGAPLWGTVIKRPGAKSDKRYMKILLVDDSPDTGFLVKKSLSPYMVEQALSVSEAWLLLASTQYHLILIDVGLPDGDGFSFCESLERNMQFEAVPKIILSGHSLTAEKVFGLSCGADDYVTKPFESAELKARVDSRLRRIRPEGVIRVGGFELNPDFQTCSYQDGRAKIDFQFTPTEYRIFLTLLRAEGCPLSRSEIVRAVWKSHGYNIEERGVDTHIAHLRKKMSELGEVVVSIYGKGYALAIPAKGIKAA